MLLQRMKLYEGPLHWIESLESLELLWEQSVVDHFIFHV